MGVSSASPFLKRSQDLKTRDSATATAGGDNRNQHPFRRHHCQWGVQKARGHPIPLQWSGDIRGTITVAGLSLVTEIDQFSMANTSFGSYDNPLTKVPLPAISYAKAETQQVKSSDKAHQDYWVLRGTLKKSMSAKDMRVILKGQGLSQKT